MNLSADTLKSYVSDVMKKQGLPEDDSKIVAESLVTANLRGVDSHGVDRKSVV